MASRHFHLFAVRMGDGIPKITISMPDFIWPEGTEAIDLSQMACDVDEFLRLARTFANQILGNEDEAGEVATPTTTGHAGLLAGPGKARSLDTTRGNNGEEFPEGYRRPIGQESTESSERPFVGGYFECLAHKVARPVHNQDEFKAEHGQCAWRFIP